VNSLTIFVSNSGGGASGLQVQFSGKACLSGLSVVPNTTTFNFTKYGLPNIACRTLSSQSYDFPTNTKFLNYINSSMLYTGLLSQTSNLNSRILKSIVSDTYPRKNCLVGQSLCSPKYGRPIFIYTDKCAFN